METNENNENQIELTEPKTESNSEPKLDLKPEPALQEPKIELNKKVTVVVATYWTRPDSKFTDELFNVYDHPTPLGIDGTLPKLLNSLRKLKEKVNLLIVGTCTEPEMNDVFEKRMRELLAHYSDLQPFFIGPSYTGKLKQRLLDLHLDKLVPYVSNIGYSNIRNLTLIGSQIIDTDIIISLDDDEIIIDNAFIPKALYGMQKEIDGEVILGKAGYYVRNRSGDFLGSDDIPWWDRYFRKGYYMNQALKKYTEPPRLKKATFVLGGNMIIAREMFEKIPFDGACLRGEDCDYLINAAFRGFKFHTDNELYILHEAPPHLEHIYGLRQDIYRFVYEAKKMDFARTQFDIHQVKPEDFDPYPGPFLKKDVARRCAALAFTTGLRDILQDDQLQHFALIKTALLDAGRFAKVWVPRYFEFEKMWPELMDEVNSDSYLAEEIHKGRL